MSYSYSPDGKLFYGLFETRLEALIAGFHALPDAPEMVIGSPLYLQPEHLIFKDAAETLISKLRERATDLCGEGSCGVVPENWMTGAMPDYEERVKSLIIRLRLIVSKWMLDHKIDPLYLDGEDGHPFCTVHKQIVFSRPTFDAALEHLKKEGAKRRAEDEARGTGGG